MMIKLRSSYRNPAFELLTIVQFVQLQSNFKAFEIKRRQCNVLNKPMIYSIVEKGMEMCNCQQNFFVDHQKNKTHIPRFHDPPFIKTPYQGKALLSHLSRSCCTLAHFYCLYDFKITISLSHEFICHQALNVSNVKLHSRKIMNN